jgi:hypothetical protein
MDRAVHRCAALFRVEAAQAFDDWVSRERSFSRWTTPESAVFERVFLTLAQDAFGHDFVLHMIGDPTVWLWFVSKSGAPGKIDGSGLK